MVWPVFSWWGTIRRYEHFFIGVIISGGIGQILTFFLGKGSKVTIFSKEIPPIGFIMISILLICGMGGILVLPAQLNVSVTGFLLGSPPATDIVSYSIILIFIATILNAITALSWRLYKMQETS